MWTGPPPRGFTGKPALTQQKEIEAADPPDLADLRTAGTGATAKGGHPTQMDGGWAASITSTIDVPDEAPAFVAARLAEGSDFLKIIYDDATASYGGHLPTLNTETIAALAAAAHARGRLAVAHIGTEQQAEGAIAAGVDGLAHLFTGPSVSPEFVQLAARRHVFVISTLTTEYSVCGKSDGPAILKEERVMARVKEQFRVTLSLPSGSINPSCEGTRAAVPLLAKAGVAIVAGTDTPVPGTTYGASLHWELEHLVDAGLTPAKR